MRAINPLRYRDPSGHWLCEDIDCKTPHRITKPFRQQQPSSPPTLSKPPVPAIQEPPWWTYIIAAPFSPNESNPLANVPGWTNPEYYQFLLDYHTSNAPHWSATASDVALGLDTTATVLSLIEALAADVVGGLLVAGGAAVAGPEGAGAGLELAVIVDVAIASESPLAGLENSLGVASLGTTIASDVFAGYTGPTKNGFAIGQDTLVAGRNMAAGFVPESNLDYLISLSQLNYDLERRGGVKEGDSIEISRAGELLHLIFLEHWH